MCRIEFMRYSQCGHRRYSSISFCEEQGADMFDTFQAGSDVRDSLSDDLSCPIQGAESVVNVVDQMCSACVVHRARRQQRRREELDAAIKEAERKHDQRADDALNDAALRDAWRGR